MDAPGGARPDTFHLEAGSGSNRFGWRKVKNDENAVGYRAVAVPGAVKGLAFALRRFGTIELSAALAPAIRLAEEGCAVSLQTGLAIAAAMRTLAPFPASAEVFLPGGFPLLSESGDRAADRLIQSDLARSLRLVAAEGPDAFYEGAIARAISDAMSVHGGLLTMEDLRTYEPQLLDPQVTRYRGYEICGVPGACGCITAQQSLNILDGFELSACSSGGAGAYHLQIEASRRAFADRYTFMGDPKAVPVPIDGMLSEQYADVVRNVIDEGRAASVITPGDPWLFQHGSRADGSVGASRARRDVSTTHICAVDAERNVVTLTLTLANIFGAGVVVPGTGIVMNNAMLWFDPEPGRPNSVAPGKRGLNNMTPLLVLRDGRAWLAVGAPGGVRIISAVTQVIANAIDHGMTMQGAINAPRIDASGFNTLADARLGQDGIGALERMGHRLVVVDETAGAAHFARPVGISVDSSTGQLAGGADSLRSAVAIGY